MGCAAKQLLLSGVLLFAASSQAYTLNNIRLDGVLTTVIEPDWRTENMALFQHDQSGRPLSGFDRLRQYAHQQGMTVRAAMNAGMYEPSRQPVGLTIISGRQISPLQLASGKGNFYLKPNGVFALTTDNQPHIVPSEQWPQWLQQHPLHSVVLATQSGPLLVSSGTLHPALTASGKSAKIRNAIGICKGRVSWLVTHEPITLYRLALAGRDQLGCHDLLYLDGTISSLMAGKWQIQRDRLGPMLALVVPDATGQIGTVK